MMLHLSTRLRAPSAATPCPAFHPRRRPGGRVLAKKPRADPEQEVVRLVRKLRSASPNITAAKMYAELENRMGAAAVLQHLPWLQEVAIRDLPSMAPLLCYAEAKKAVNAMLLYRPYAHDGIFFNLQVAPPEALFLVVEAKPDQEREGADALVVWAIMDSIPCVEEPGSDQPEVIPLPSHVTVTAAPMSHRTLLQEGYDIQDAQEGFNSHDLLRNFSERLVDADHPLFGESLAEAMAAATSPGGIAPDVEARLVTVDALGLRGPAWLLLW